MNDGTTKYGEWKEISRIPEEINVYKYENRD